jgi:hypothetical protein
LRGKVTVVVLAGARTVKAGEIESALAVLLARGVLTTRICGGQLLRLARLIVEVDLIGIVAELPVE